MKSLPQNELWDSASANLLSHSRTPRTNEEPYSYEDAIDKANKIQGEAHVLIAEGNLQDAYHKYRACYWITREIHEKCPESYRDEAIESVKYAKSVVECLHMQLKSKNESETKAGVLSQVVGQDEVRDKIVKLLKRRQYARDINQHNDDPSIFMYGPSGCGKSHMAKEIASQLGLDIIIVKGRDIFGKYVGESEEKLGQLFEEAAKKKTILFFDEIHALFGNDSQELSESGEKITTEFQKLMDDKKLMSGLIVMAATNEPWRVKVSVHRRFEEKYELKLPDTQARCALLKYFIDQYRLLNFLRDDGIKEFAEKMQDFSPNDIRNLVKAVDSMIMDKIIESTYFRPISVNGGKGKVFVPCESHEKGAIKTTGRQCPGRVCTYITHYYMEKALKEYKKPEIPENHLEKLRNFK